MDGARNCEADPERKDFEFIFHPLLASTRINMCPRAYIDPYCEWLFEQFVAWKKFGALPYGPALYAQPAIMIEGFHIIQAAIEKMDNLKDRRDKWEKDRETNKNGTNRRRSPIPRRKHGRARPRPRGRRL